MDPAVYIVIASVLVLTSFAAVLAKRYKRCPSNRVLVIYGRVSEGRSARCMHGGGSFVWPLIQDFSYLSLDPMQIEIPLRGALSMPRTFASTCPASSRSPIGTESTGHEQTAADPTARPRGTKQIMKQAEDIILGQLRQVIASMTIEDINRNRDKLP